MESSNDADDSSSRWTCDACGCNTNPETDRACSICGTSRGPSLLRRVDYVSRPALLARNLAARRNIMGEEFGMDYDLWDRGDDDVDMQGDEDEQDIAALAMEMVGAPGRGPQRHRAVMPVGRGFAMAAREPVRPEPAELLRAAYENSALYQPKWINPSQIGGRMRTGNGIEVGDGENQTIAHLPLGAGEGRALRALEAFPRSAPFASFSLTSADASNHEQRPRRAFGFRVAFEHPNTEAGKSMNGNYLVGVTTTSFAAFSERNALKQSAFFWGIEDNGKKYEGSRGSSSRDARRGHSGYAIDINPTEAPRNSDNALFGSRDIVTCVVDFESRSLTFWRNDEVLGTLVTTLPRGGSLYPIVVPYKAGSTVAISGMGVDPLPLLRTYASDWKQAQQEKDAQRRQQLQSERSTLIQDGLLTPALVDVLRSIFSWYSRAAHAQVTLDRVQAARLWYRCGIKLSHLNELLATKSPSSDVVNFNDFVKILAEIARDDDEEYGNCHATQERSDDFQVGDRVELVEGYERFGDASNGPLQPGDRGRVIELQESPTGERSSVRVIYSSRRWWYQPQAIAREKSGLVESPVVWFLRTILRAHGYDHATLKPLVGKDVKSSSWQVGDFVVPKKLATSGLSSEETPQASPVLHEEVGRIVAESSTSTNTLSVRGRGADSVLVEFATKGFAEASGLQVGSSLQGPNPALECKRVPVQRLVYTTTFHGKVVAPFDLNKRQPQDEETPPLGTPDVMDVESGMADIPRSSSLSDRASGDIKKLAKLDPDAIENLTKECRKNSTTLAGLFGSGLAAEILNALEVLIEKSEKSNLGEGTAKAVASLGKLALAVVESAFEPTPTTAASSDRQTKNDDSEGVASQEEISQDTQTLSNIYRHTRNDAQAARSGQLESLQQEVSHAGQLSSMQRRNMFLTLMSRVRHGNAGAVGDFLERDTQSSPPDSGIHNMMPSLDPFRHDAAALLFGAASESGGQGETWDSQVDMRTVVQSPPSSILRSRLSAGQEDHVASTASRLDAILRGRSPNSSTDTPASKAAGLVDGSFLKTAILNGLLGNSLHWLQAAQDGRRKANSQKQTPKATQSICDEDGLPVLELAISLGCSPAIIRHLIRSGSPVGEAEIQTAILTDQPETLAAVLQYSVCSKEMIDFDQCSARVRSVVEGALRRQETERESVVVEASSLLVSFVQKLFQLGVSCRRRVPRDGHCERAIASGLVGNVVVEALQKKQHQAIASSSGGSMSESARPRSRSQRRGQSNPAPITETRGLLQVEFDSMEWNRLFQQSSGMTNFLLLTEDYLCSKEINDSAVGLTLLTTMLKLVPSFRRNREIDRYGLSELVSSHDAFASNKLAEISARVAARVASSSATEAENLAVSGIVLCPKEHAAALHVTMHSSFRCDLCGKGVDQGRVMHGCRECDWDACERCTDKAEGGIVKWGHIRELASECRVLLKRNLLSTPTEPYGDLGQSEPRDNSVEVNHLSIRLLQRDTESVQDLGARLTSSGDITMHQFVSVILPALHAALLGKAAGKSAPFVQRPRSKKPRVTGSTAPEVDDSFLAGTTEDRVEFAREIVKHLVVSATGAKKGGTPEQSTTTTSHVDNVDSGSRGRTDATGGAGNSETEMSARLPTSELLRRLHQVLALYENLPLPPKANARPGRSVLSGDLQSLKKPVAICLLPHNGNELHRKSPPSRSFSLSIHAEPLMSVEDLARFVLRTCRVSHPNFTAYCRSLAASRAIILERPLSNDKDNMRSWKIAKVVSFDDSTGSHSIQYVRSLDDTLLRKPELRRNNMEQIYSSKFDLQESKLILASREYHVLSRNASFDEAKTRSAFDMDHLLPDDFVTQLEEERNTQDPNVGTRVHSNINSTDWRPYTVLAVSRAEARASQGAIYTLVSDEGEIMCKVAPHQLRGLISRARGTGEEGTHGRRVVGAEDGESRGHASRAFPFLALRRRPEGGRRDMGNSTPRHYGVLTRRWSALSLAESMCPIELNLSEIPKSRTKGTRLHQWKCDIGGRELVLRVDGSILESPPLLQVRFRADDIAPPIDISSPGDTTVLSLLWQISEGNDACLSEEHVHQVFYSIHCEPYQESTEVKDADDVFQHNDVSSWACLDLDAAGAKAASIESSSSQGMRPIEIRHESKKRPPWSLSNRSGKFSHSASSYDADDEDMNLGSCDGLDEICVQCMEIIGYLADTARSENDPGDPGKVPSGFENEELSSKLAEQLDDPLMVVGGALPDWCFTAPTFAPSVFSYKVRRLLLERAAFGVSRSTLKQQESKVNVGRLRQRMASLRARAVELVGEAFSGGAEDPTALQLQADELYGMEEALASRVRAAFKNERWEEHALQVAKAAVNRDLLISDAISVMNQYANDCTICRRRLEVRFNGESGFDAASGDEAGVTRGFYADVAEALLSCDIVSGVGNGSICPDGQGISTIVTAADWTRKGLPCKLPLWIPDVDASGQVTIPTPRADPSSGLGVFPRPLAPSHVQYHSVLDTFRFIGRLFASAMRDNFMFPIPLSSAFLKLVQHGNMYAGSSLGWTGISVDVKSAVDSDLRSDDTASQPKKTVGKDMLLASSDLPRPGFLGGEVFAVESNVCNALDKLDQMEPPLPAAELDQRYEKVASDKSFARAALGRSYDCSFEEYFENRTFVDPLDPSQGIEATPLCPNGHTRSVTIYNIREWVTLSKEFLLQDGVLAQALAFRQGVEDFFSADYLRLFTAEELQKDVCGGGDNVDNWDEAQVRNLFKLDGGKGAVEALVAVTAIGGEGGAALSRRFGPSSPTIKFVVKALLEATPKMRRQFLSFVTSVPIVTPGQIEVVPLVSPRSGEFLPMRDPGCLPRANTCARRLYLPKFETYESFSQVLWAVVREESKFKGFYEWRGS